RATLERELVNHGRTGSFSDPFSPRSYSLLFASHFLGFSLSSFLQTEKAFLKQPKVFLSSKKSSKGKRPGKGGNRFWKSIGLGFKTPREAIEGTYIDKKCPFAGTVSIRGRILAGTCHSAKMIRTIIVRRNYLHYIKKYQRHDAAPFSCTFLSELPLSKTVRFNVLKVIPAGSSGGGKKAFTGM
ncbi:hypothetical protein Godav_025696, partial [Gossypium davidsonii]|nr:hypothetical protein [Gossypium davidsonii]